MAGASIRPCSRSSATSCCGGTSSSSPSPSSSARRSAPLVTAFVASFITPLIAAIGGKPDFSALAFTINGSRFTYGAFFNALLSFLIIAAVIFFFVVRPLNTLMARLKPEPAVDQVVRARARSASRTSPRRRGAARSAPRRSGAA